MVHLLAASLRSVSLFCCSFFQTALILFKFAQRDCASPMIPIFFKTFPIQLTTTNLAQAQYYKNPVFYIELIENEFAAAIQNFNHCGSKKFESSAKRISSRGQLTKILQQISIREKLSSLIIASSAFLLMGTMTALWSNPYFIRMTEENVWDYLILSVEALLIGLFFGIRAPRCATKKAVIGGIFLFFWFWLLSL